MSEKKYGGKLERWYKQDISDFYEPGQLTKAYGPNLEFIIHGILGHDPTGRGFGNSRVRTSLVVKFEPGRIETLNTVYDLGDPRIEN